MGEEKEGMCLVEEDVVGIVKLGIVGEEVCLFWLDKGSCEVVSYEKCW